MVWMRCASESSPSLSANTPLKGRDTLRLLDQSLPLPPDPHPRPKDVLLPNPRPLSLYRGTDPSLLCPRKLCGTLSQSRPACDCAVPPPCPVVTAILSSLWFFPSLSLSRVWVTNVCPAVVLFYDLALLLLPLIFSDLFYAGRRHPPTSLISHSPHTPRSLDFISCLRFPIITPSLCVQPVLSCSRFYRMCILLPLPLTCFIVHICCPFRLFIFPP